MKRLHTTLAITAAVLAWGAAAADLRSPLQVTQLAGEIDREADHVSALELGEMIMQADSSLRVFDLRSPREFTEFHIPGAKHASISDLARMPLSQEARIVLYSEGSAHAAQAWVLLRVRGYRNVSFLREGIYEWVSRVHDPVLALDATPREREEFKQAEELSRFFGGLPRSGVPRSEVPPGYWTETEAYDAKSPATNQAIANIRRRGC